MNLWDWLWAWGQDEEVWDWLRPLLAALAGAVIGGLFTLWGQGRQTTAQSILQDQQWQRERADGAHRESLVVAREVFDRFTKLQREVQLAEPSFNDRVTGASWVPSWEKIWTDEVSFELDVRSRLIADLETRSAVQRLTRLLDQAKDLSADGGYTTSMATRLRTIATHLTAEGIEVAGAYIRRDQAHSTKRGDFMKRLEAAQLRHEEWEEHEIARAEAAAEEASEPKE